MSNGLKEVAAWTGEENLSDLLHHHYGIRLKGAEPVRGVLKLQTDEGPFVLKRVRSGEKDRWKWVAELARHVEMSGCEEIRIPQPLFTASGRLYFHGYRFPYVLLPWLEGKPLSFNRADDWRRASRALARFHQSTVGFKPGSSGRRYDCTGKWLAEWEHVCQQLDIFRLAAKWTPNPTEADQSWLQTASYISGLMENLLEYYQKIDGDEPCQKSIPSGKCCHNRLHRHNLLADDEGWIQFVDWNQAVLDIRLRDLAQWLTYAYGRTGSQQILTDVLKSYQEVAPLEEGEYSLLYARMLFPEKLFHLLRRVYQKQDISIHSAAPDIQKAVQTEEKKAGLLRGYTAAVKEEFHITIPKLDWLH
ncbi:phosphotransferase [Lihuaxuella thermophila]|uniref:Spore coat protein, CotS family n=1 Tax=Lihuaxuella thermophila TaxID=1173111 RepID=A0A1H8HKX7_9BACL|nr:phosphotransferase [Lihuaxuella thermophila]SEN56769.1 spore coat protein, CotS family [Lihuaxuella thermophila]